MATKTPSAEEVLAMYQVIYDTGEVCEPLRAFHEAYQQWQASQGPVTREWFVERFGGLFSEWELFGICWLSGDVFLGVKRRGEYVYNRVPNPTRSKIEALVEMLGGESCT